LIYRTAVADCEEVSPALDRIRGGKWKTLDHALMKHD